MTSQQATGSDMAASGCAGGMTRTLIKAPLSSSRVPSRRIRSSIRQCRSAKIADLVAGIVPRRDPMIGRQ